MYNTIVTKSKLAHSYLLAKAVPIFFFCKSLLFYNLLLFANLLGTLHDSDPDLI